MTHPLVSAFHRLGLYASVFREASGKQSPAFFEKMYKEQVQPIDEFITEVMASSPYVRCFVGFYHGHNNRPFLIWLWPLSQVAEYSIFEGRYYRHDRNHLDRNHLDPVRVVLPHFLRS